MPSETVAVPARGRLLYETACASCHNRKTHWRNRHWVTDWSTLTSQVRKWQTIAGQNWGGEEIDDVAAYLNRRFYNVPCPLPGCTTGKVG